MMGRDQYLLKMSELLDDKEVYRNVREGPGKWLQKKVGKYFKKLVTYKSVKLKCKDDFVTTYVRVPRLKVLCKTYNDGLPMWPILDGIDSPVYKFTKFLIKH